MLYLHKILEVDPTNADALRFISILDKAAQRQQQQRAAGAKPKPGAK